MEPTIRPATGDDIEQITAIYNEYIVDSHVSFDEEPHTPEHRRAWLAAKDGRFHQVWVAEVKGEVVGAAWSGPWRDKEAYRRSVETTVVIDPEWTGRGIGRPLYAALLDAIAAAGVHRAYAIVALPNDHSVGFHHALGFRTVGVLDDAGYKLGRWWSTELLEKKLG